MTKDTGLFCLTTVLRFHQLPADPQQLNNASLPAIAINRQGDFFIIARVSHSDQGEGKVLVMEAELSQPKSLSESALSEMWGGDLILVARREGLVAQFKEFDIRWFIPSLLKYRKMFGEVILISFFSTT